MVFTRNLMTFAIVAVSTICLSQEILIHSNTAVMDLYPKMSNVIEEYEIFTADPRSLMKNLSQSKRATSLSIHGHGKIFNIVLEETQLISPSFRFFLQGSNGKQATEVNSKIKTYKGYFSDGKEGQVRLTISDDGFLYGFIADGVDEYFIEPLSYYETDGDTNGKFVFYNKDMVINEHNVFHCERNHSTDNLKYHNDINNRNSGTCYKAKLAVYADYSMYMDPAHAGIEAVVSHVIGVMNNVQSLYEYNGDNNFNSGIEFELNEIIISTCPECDPVSDSKIASTCLNQFSQWVINGGFSERPQLAQFWSDRTFNNSVVGLAFQSPSLLCEQKAHSVIRDFTNTAALLRTLVAHETAHNFNGIHDNTSGFVLSPTVTSSSLWSSASKLIVGQQINNQSMCLISCNENTCERVTNIQLAEINTSSFRVTWSDVANGFMYNITLTDASSDEIVLDTLITGTNHLFAPRNYKICGKYKLSIKKSCTTNNFSEDQTVVFSSPASQGCADFVNSSNVNWVNGMVNFTDKSINALSWHWDFGNGVQSELQHPSIAFSKPGIYDISLTVNNGAHTCTKQSLIKILPTITPEIQSYQNIDFMSLFVSDILEGNLNVWEYGTSDYYLMTQGNAWKTSLNSNIPKGTYKSVLYSPKFDLSLSPNYILNFDLSMQVEFCNAPVAAQLQYSIDNGLSWQRLGNAPDFYNNAPGQNCSITSKLFADRTGWAFSGHYQNKSLDLSFLAGNKSVILRFVFAVDGIFISGYDVDGLLVDNFIILSLNTSVLGINANSLVVNRTPDNSNLLEWEADEVTKLDRFEVLKSIDGKKFDFIHTLVKIDHFQKKYMYLDDSSVNIYSPYTFYQVRSVDYDSKTVSSNIVKIKNQLPEMKLFPNPVSKGVALTMLMNIEMNNISYKIFDVFSRLVHSNHAVNSLNNIDVSTLESGTYTIMIYSGKEFVTAQTVVII